MANLLLTLRGFLYRRGLIECCYLSSRCKVHKISGVHFLLLPGSPVLRLILMCLQGVANQQTFTSSAIQLQPFEQPFMKFTQPYFPSSKCNESERKVKENRVEVLIFFPQLIFSPKMFFMLAALCVGNCNFACISEAGLKFCQLNALLHNNKFKPFHVGLACNTIKYEV